MVKETDLIACGVAIYDPSLLAHWYAMAAGVADHRWTLEEIGALIPEPTVAAWGSKRAANSK